jgi:glycosyltransferase involved in cell wall biosynthesis
VPCYNEEEALLETARQLKMKLSALITEKKIDSRSRILLVNDGSKDKTWDVISSFVQEDHMFEGINLSNNRGHQNALLAGLLTASEQADMIVSLDADLQDDIHAIDEMVEKYYAGNDVVYGVRKDRTTDSFFKRMSAEGFYRLMHRLGVKSVFNHADYRLMSQRAVRSLKAYKEVNLFLRGIIPLIGFSSDFVYYDRGNRVAGESKYPLKKMIAFAIEGITSLSVQPIRYISYAGFFIASIALVYICYILIQYFCGDVVTGWSSMIASIWLLGGLILFSIGVIGEYVGKIYLETKGRPRYIIDQYIYNDSAERHVNLVVQDNSTRAHKPGTVTERDSGREHIVQGERIEHDQA